MNRTAWGPIAAVVVLLVPASARGQYEESRELPVGSRGHALELGTGAGFAQVWNPASTSRGGRVLATGTGGALDLELAYRATANLGLGVWGEGAQLGVTVVQPVASSLYGAAAGIGGAWHFRPRALDVDPWIAVGAGWRGQWFVYQGGGTYSEHGLEAARVRAGVDVRVSPAVAIGPVVGGSADVFLTQELPGGSWIRVRSSQLGESFFAGVRGTFDVPLRQTP